MSVRINNPGGTSIFIRLRHETSDADLAQALEQNAFVTSINILVYFDPAVQLADWGSLLRVIATRENLVKVTLTAAQGRNAPHTLVRAFLRSIQQNASIRCVLLQSLRLPPDVSSFVDTASAIASFSFWNCDFAPTDREHGIRDLAAALQRNTNIERLQLSISEGYAIPVLQGLQSNDFLKSLAIRGPDATSHATHQLLESTTSIARFELISVIFSSGEMFRPVAQSILRSASVSALNFRLCIFRDEECTPIFQSILQEKRNLATLHLDRCMLRGRQVHDAIISSLSQPDSPLRNLVIVEYQLDSKISEHPVRDSASSTREKQGGTFCDWTD